MEKKKRQPKIAQSYCPWITLEAALVVPQTLRTKFFGKAQAPDELAKACGISPTSSGWRKIAGGAAAYGLTIGAQNAQEICLTELGERVVSALQTRENIQQAMREAALTPTLFQKFDVCYKNSKLPQEDQAVQFFVQNGIPEERAAKAWTIFQKNAEFAETSRRYTKGNRQRRTESPNRHAGTAEERNLALCQGERLSGPDVFVFCQPGDSAITRELESLLAFGNMKAKTPQEGESWLETAEIMRSCEAGIIQVDEEKYCFGSGSYQKQISGDTREMVGAAMMCYGKRLILLCKAGTELPAHFQEYRCCEYSDGKIDFSTMIRLLKELK